MATSIIKNDLDLAPPVDDGEDTLDWDFYLENPPQKPTTTIELEFGIDATTEARNTN